MSESVDPDPDVLRRRWACRSAARLAELQRRQSLRVSRLTIDQYLSSFGSRPRVAREQVTVAGVPAHRFTSDSSSNDLCLVFIHGGGFHTGSGDASAAMLGMLSEQTGATVLSCDYRLAPEHRHPAALDDVAAVLDHTCRTLGASRVAVVGSSAGGNLAVGAMQRRVAARKDMPSSLVLFSPLLDLRATADSYKRNAANDASLSRASVRGIARSYLGDVPPDAPEASPLLGSAAGFSPTLVFASTSEVVQDDAIRWSLLVEQAGIPTECVLEPNLPHAWPTFAASLPAALSTIERAAKFISAHFGK